MPNKQTDDGDEIYKLFQNMYIELGSAAQRAYGQSAYNEAASDIRKKYTTKLLAREQAAERRGRIASLELVRSKGITSGWLEDELQQLAQEEQS